MTIDPIYDPNSYLTGEDPADSLKGDLASDYKPIVVVVNVYLDKGSSTAGMDPISHL